MMRASERRLVSTGMLLAVYSSRQCNQSVNGRVFEELLSQTDLHAEVDERSKDEGEILQISLWGLSSAGHILLKRPNQRCVVNQRLQLREASSFARGDS